MTEANAVHALEAVYRAFDEYIFRGKLKPCEIRISHAAHPSNYPDVRYADGILTIPDEYVNCPIAKTAVGILHGMVHRYCESLGVKDTSRNGTYHNNVFQTFGSNVGLVFQTSVSDQNGAVPMDVSATVLDVLFRKHIKAITGVQVKEKASPASGDAVKHKHSTRRYTCPNCGVSVKATRPVKVLCGECRVLMISERPENNDIIQEKTELAERSTDIKSVKTVSHKVDHHKNNPFVKKEVTTHPDISEKRNGATPSLMVQPASKQSSNINRETKEDLYHRLAAILMHMAVTKYTMSAN